jgi:hypothetical protein
VARISPRLRARARSTSRWRDPGLADNGYGALAATLRYYVDLLRDCRDCGRSFLFFAQEQKYWFEELQLQFYVDADCAHCSECRARQHDARTQLARFSAAMKTPDLNGKDLMKLIDDAAVLLQAGVVSNLSKLGALKNRALRECGEDPGTLRLAQAFGEAHRD